MMFHPIYGPTVGRVSGVLLGPKRAVTGTGGDEG
jgi:hypothetical protein